MITLKLQYAFSLKFRQGVIEMMIKKTLALQPLIKGKDMVY